MRTVRPSTQLSSATRRYASTTPASKKSSWRGTVARWGLAFGAVYWYNTSPIFADEALPQTHPAPSNFSEDDLPTVEAIVEQKRREARTLTPVTPEPKSTPEPTLPPQTQDQTAEAPLTPAEADAGIVPGSPEALEEEAGQQGAFNPETGEINWDCPCLGGMAHGPCGEEFKAAFSCFVYSTEEPKGMECIDKFQHMQDCFRKHPDIYGAELQDDDEETEAPEAVPAANPAANNEDVPALSREAHKVDTPAPEATDSQKPGTVAEPSRKPVYEEKLEDSDVIPKKAVDATDANVGKQ